MKVEFSKYEKIILTVSSVLVCGWVVQTCNASRQAISNQNADPKSSEEYKMLEKSKNLANYNAMISKSIAETAESQAKKQGEITAKLKKELDDLKKRTPVTFMEREPQQTIDAEPEEQTDLLWTKETIQKLDEIIKSQDMKIVELETSVNYYKASANSFEIAFRDSERQRRCMELAHEAAKNNSRNQRLLGRAEGVIAEFAINYAINKIKK